VEQAKKEVGKAAERDETKKAKERQEAQDDEEDKTRLNIEQIQPQQQKQVLIIRFYLCIL
jgi:hypothetical protein